MARSPEENGSEDPARRLARQLGEVRARGEALVDMTWGDETLVAAVQETVAERNADRRIHPTTAQSNRMWRAIEAEMEPAPAPALATGLRTRLVTAWRALTHPPVRRWAAGVAVLIAMVGAWVLLWPAGPERVAAAGETVQTYTTPGHVTVQLRPQATLYRVPVDTVSRYRLEGEAYFTVPSRTDTTAFEVETDEARVRVLGTRFVVRTWGDGTEVYLEEGSVRVGGGRRSQRSRRLAPGERAAVSPEGRVTAPDPASPSAYLGWLDRTLTFERRPLRDIIAELEYHYALTIRVPGRLRDATLSGQIALDGPTQSLNDLAVVLGADVKRIDDDTYRLVPQ